MTLTVLNRKGTPMTDDQLMAAAHEMDRIGGGFASAIATAYFRADSDNKARLLLTFGDLFSRHARETDETIREVVAKIRERVTGPWYALGWDLIAETFDDATLERWVQACGGTLDETWEALAEQFRLPAQIHGAWVVRTSDTDGTSITQHNTFSAAVQHFGEILGRTPADDTLLRLEDGTDNYIAGTSDYGTRVSLERI